MNVKNRKCIRHLSYKYLMASKKRNLVAISAIALTALLFTALFTIVLSINRSYEEYTFRQIGGYAHGTFEDVTKEQAKNLAGHPKVKAYGKRISCGVAVDGAFSKKTAEVSYMDANTAKWSYAVPKKGRLPESGKEIAMDTDALKKLGVSPKLGEKVTLTYKEGHDGDIDPVRTDTFTLVGYWDYDALVPVHYINVSEEYVTQTEKNYTKNGGEAFRIDLNIMLASSLNIEKEMQEIDTACGYQWNDRGLSNYVKAGANWGYTGSSLLTNFGTEGIAAVAAALLLVIFTGYLIIYNIFQISVSGDIRFYGMLKTIGTTPRQLKRMIRYQAFFLAAAGIPAGEMLGYLVGRAAAPAMYKASANTAAAGAYHASMSPVIFIGTAVFAFATVFLSCARPGKIAARITPVEAIRYTLPTGQGRFHTGNGGFFQKSLQKNSQKRKNKISRKASRNRSDKSHETASGSIPRMACKTLSRNPGKTALVTVSLALAVVLLNCLFLLVNGFDMEKFLSKSASADFVVGSTGYFQSCGDDEENGLSAQTVKKIRTNIDADCFGEISVIPSTKEPVCWISEDAYKAASYLSGAEQKQEMASREHRGNLIGAYLTAEGFDESLLKKLTVCEGSLAPLTDASQHAIAVAGKEGDDGKISSSFQVGDTLTVTYAAGHDVKNTVCAVISIPNDISFRYASEGGVQAVLTSDALSRDSKAQTQTMLCAFDMPDSASESAAEQWLSDYTKDKENLSYESKKLLRESFTSFKNMFVLVGGALCFIVGLIGILNFFNTILTGILARSREFAILQSVGMTGRQLKQMLICEGIFYAAAALILALILSLLFNPLLGKTVGNIFWFFKWRFTVLPVLAMIPVFLLLGTALPVLIHHFTSGKSIVERLGESS